MSCELILSSVGRLGGCVETAEGSRLTTHCLYPSFDPVHVYVVKWGQGFRVHDGGGAYRSAWLHGRDQSLIKRTIDVECRNFHAKREGETIFIDLDTADWLTSGITSVANASSFAAHSAVARLVASHERQLVDQIEKTLLGTFGASHVSREVEITGKSGGKRRFDLIVNTQREDMIFVNGVSAHHASVNSKYVAFSDTEGDKEKKLAVHDRPLEADNVALLQQVAIILPFSALRSGAQRAATPNLSSIS